VMGQLRKALGAVPGLQVFPQLPPPIQLSGRFAQAQYQYTLQGTDPDPLYKTAQRLEDSLRDAKGLMDVSTDLQIKNPQVLVHVDRDKAASYGLTERQVEDALYSAYGTRRVSTIYAPNNDYDVLM